jgi:hypothetical protein
MLARTGTVVSFGEARTSDGFRWLTTVFSVPALLALFFRENIIKLFEQEGWSKLLASSWHPFLDKIFEIVSGPIATFVFGSCAGVAGVRWMTDQKTDRIGVSLADTSYVAEVRVSVEQNRPRSI